MFSFKNLGKVLIIAELSANHNQDKQRALDIIKAAKEAGADAIKLQTYTADTLTLDCNNEYFQIKGTIWEGMTLHDLYKEAYTPWEWHAELKDYAEELGLIFFSSPFDASAVDFLETLNVPLYKVASCELVDIPLLEKIGSTGKPVLVSTGMGTLSEIEEAVTTLKNAGAPEIALLKCTTAYPAPPEETNLATIPHMAQTFNCLSGLSDHTMGISVSVAAVAMGARIIEKHFTLSRADEGPDSSFSLEPHEFKDLVDSIRVTEKAIGSISYSLTQKQKESIIFRRSLFVAEDIARGEKFTPENVRSVRPANGLHTRYYSEVLGQKAQKDLKKGTPLEWKHIS
ncbi:pseudaminic acid synthase [Maridesulfovibrio sp.]|uniref:pseudaminic acid synthase n=1 Tax=Maridesulfovibrio sp. TaxID=2795000 RepID=UPI0029CA63B0|nr:pseudaminic acid synthase [Maridesulfovibrio sp.]